MKAMFCEYCGYPLSEGCGCARELAEYEAEVLEDLENRPDTLYGWYQQDLIDMHRAER